MTEALENEENEMMFIKVRVQNPQYEASCYVSYEIQIETNNPCFNLSKSMVRRRYSEFVVLRKLLSKEFPAMKMPPLPPRSFFQDRFHPEFVKKRSEALEDFLTKLISNRMYLSSKAFHLFLQTYYSIHEITDIIRGKILNSEVYDPEMSSERLPEPSTSNLSSTQNNINYNFMNGSDSAEHSLKYNSTKENEFSDCSNDSSLVNKREKISSSIPYVSNNSPAGSKRVSFCDQVIVAQIHVEET